MQKNSFGFTLIELLVVVLIIGILSAELHFYPNGKFEIPCCIGKVDNPFQCQMLVTAFGKDVVTACN